MNVIARKQAEASADPIEVQAVRERGEPALAKSQQMAPEQARVAPDRDLFAGLEAQAQGGEREEGRAVPTRPYQPGQPTSCRASTRPTGDREQPFTL